MPANLHHVNKTNQLIGAKHMDQISIAFPAGDKKAAALFGAALVEYAGGTIAAPAEPAPAPSAPAPDTTGAPSNSGQQQQEPDPAPDNSGGVDTKGVAFNPDYCGKAKEPFYNSGPRAGQWKKRRGTEVTDAVYDAWYAAELERLQEAADPGEGGQVDTAGAFGVETPPPPASDPAPAPTFANFQDFITWVSEQQNAGNLTQADVDEAYQAVGVAVTDLFPPATPDEVADRLAKLHTFLSAKGAQ